MCWKYQGEKKIKCMRNRTNNFFLCHSLPSYPHTVPRTINIIIILTYETYPSHLKWKEDEDFDKFIFILLREIRTANKLLNQVCSLMFSSSLSFSCFLIFFILIALPFSPLFSLKLLSLNEKSFFFVVFISLHFAHHVNINVYKSTPNSEFEWDETLLAK